MRQVAVATLFLTRLPWPVSGAVGPDDIAQASRHYPLVGLLIGGLLAGLHALALQWWPAWPAAVFTALASAALTGAFHEDALADAADALGGGRDPAHKLAIMSDSRLGTYGVLALVGALLWRCAVLAHLPPTLAALALVAIHGASRVGIVWLLWRAPRAKLEGLGAGAVGVGAQAFLVACAWGALALLALPWPLAMGVTLLLAASTAWLQAWAQAHVGGVTGDLLGSAQQTGEAAAWGLVLAWAGALGEVGPEWWPWFQGLTQAFTQA